MQRHRALGGVEDEELTPGESQQCYLVRYLKIREEGNISCPFDGGKQKARCEFTNIIDTHDVVWLHALSVTGDRVGFGPQKQRYETTAQVRVAIERIPDSVGQGVHPSWPHGLCWWNSSSLDRFSPHTHLEAFFQAAILALISMVLVDRAVSVRTTRVGQVSSHTAFEETLAPFARELAVMFPARFVTAHHAFFVGVFSFIFGYVVGPVSASVGVWG